MWYFPSSKIVNARYNCSDKISLKSVCGKVISDIDIFSFDTLNIIPSNNMYDSNELPPYDKNGNVINNIFDVKDFKVRTQIVKSLTKYGNNNREAHESFFMPKATIFKRFIN